MVAIAVLRGRVAPVLDWSTKILLIRREEGNDSTLLELENWAPYERLVILKNEGVTTLICGALSPELLHYARGLGLRVIHGIAGEIQDVLMAYQQGELDQPRFWLPGCRGPRRYRGIDCLGPDQWAKGENLMGFGKGQGGRQGTGGRGAGGGGSNRGGGAGRGSGRCAGGQGQGRGQKGSAGTCVCPHCGEKVPHKRGIPCQQTPCPKCGQSMVRGGGE